jgi:putative transposase
MANTYVRVIIHYIWSTKGREPLIRPSIEERVWSYIAGIAHQRGMKAIKVGGIEDHVHVVIELAKQVNISEVAKHLKGFSSRWINKEGLTETPFAWQDGFGAYSVSPSHLESLVRYVENQREHHATQSFEDEYLEFLKRYGVAYKPEYLWG